MRVIVYLCMLFLLTACIGNDMDNGEVIDSGSGPVQDGLTVKAIEMEKTVDYDVKGWFDRDHILYNVTEGDGESSLFRHHLYSGESTFFASFDGTIEAVYPNGNHSAFAVKISESYEEKTLYIIDEHGTELLSKSIEGVDFSFYWNPYEDMTAALGILDETFNTRLYTVSLNDGEEWEMVQDFPYYSQWLGEDKLAYLNWKENPYDFKAPLNVWHLSSSFSIDSDQKRHDDVIMFYGLSTDYYLTVTIEEEDHLISRFQLYDLNTEKPLEKWKSPSFKTESGDWWVPEISYQDNLLYYYERTSEHPRFSLVMLEIESMDKQELATFSETSSIALSPDGNFILTGDKLENIFNLKTHELKLLLQ